MSSSGLSRRHWNDERGGTAGLSRYLATIRRHLVLVIACVILTLAGAVAYVQLAHKTYSAQAQLAISPASSQNTVLFSLPVLHQSGDPVTDMLTAANLITTAQVADGVISKLHLHTTPSALLSKIQVTPVAQSEILSVQAQASSPTQAANLANAFASTVVAQRTAQVHQALKGLIPGLQAQVNGLPASQRNSSPQAATLAMYKQYLTQSDPTIKFTNPATPPSGPTSPRRSLALVVGGLIGLLLGIGAAFAFEAFDPRLQREEQVAELRGRLPVLARVPRIRKRPKARPMVPMELSAAALEQYRMLQATLSVPTRRDGRGDGNGANGGHVFLITGSAPSEGKTTSALSLATVLAHGGARVILIESDLRRPSVAKALSLVDYIGTEQVLSGEADLADAVQEVRFGRGGFEVLAAHHAPEPAELLSYAAAEQLVDAARARADYVVIDSPPLTAVVDALPFVLAAEHTVIVARLGHTHRSKLNELIELITRLDRSPSGLVLVGLPPGRTNLYYYEATNHGIQGTLPETILTPASGRRSRS